MNDLPTSGHPALDAPVPYVTTGERWTPRNGLDELLEAGWTLDSALAHLDGTCDRALCTGTHEGDPADLADKAADAWRDALQAAYQAGYLLARSMRPNSTDSDHDRSDHAHQVSREAEARAWRAQTEAVAR